MLSVVRKSLREINSGLKRALAAFGGIGLSHSTCALFGLGECLTGMLKRILGNPSTTLDQVVHATPPRRRQPSQNKRDNET